MPADDELGELKEVLGQVLTILNEDYEKFGLCIFCGPPGEQIDVLRRAIKLAEWGESHCQCE